MQGVLSIALAHISFDRISDCKCMLTFMLLGSFKTLDTNETSLLPIAYYYFLFLPLYTLAF